MPLSHIRRKCLSKIAEATVNIGGSTSEVICNIMSNEIKFENLMISDVPDSLILEFNKLCNLHSYRFEVSFEVFVLKHIRSSTESNKMINFINNIDKLDNRRCLRKIFYETVIGSFKKGNKEKIIYDILRLPGSKVHLYNFLFCESVNSIISNINEFNAEKVDSIDTMYYYVLDLINNHYKFDQIFKKLDFDVQKSILVLAIEKHNSGMLSYIDMCKMFSLFGDNELKLLSGTSPVFFFWTMENLSNHLLINKNYEDYLLAWVEVAAKTNFNYLPLKYGNFICKVKIAEILAKTNTQMFYEFINNFANAPELEEIILFT